MSEIRHRNGQCLHRHRFGNTIGVHEDCTLAHFAGYHAIASLSGTGPVSPGNSPRYLEDDEWETASFTTNNVDLVAETSSGRLWFATASIAVAARSW